MPLVCCTVSSHFIGTCRIIPTTFFCDPTRHTVVVDVQAVSVGPAVSSNVTAVFTVHLLGVCLTLSFYHRSGPPVVCCVCLTELLGQGGNGCGEVSDFLIWVIMVYLSAAASVARLMRTSLVPSISLKVFDPWYPPARVETFCFLLNILCAAWKCAWKFAQVFLACPVVLFFAIVIK